MDELALVIAHVTGLIVGGYSVWAVMRRRAVRSARPARTSPSPLGFGRVAAFRPAHGGMDASLQGDLGSDTQVGGTPKS